MRALAAPSQHNSDPMSQAKGILFPYMEWAQSESFRSPYSLAQSGMPLPATEVLGGLAPEEWLAYPSTCLLYTSPSPRDLSTSRMPSSA